MVRLASVLLTIAAVAFAGAAAAMPVPTEPWL
jgi:hypothetical protein